MDYGAKKCLFFLLVCWISFKGCAAFKVTVPDIGTVWVGDSSASLSCQVTENPPTVTWAVGSGTVVARWNEDTGPVIENPDGKYDMTGDGQNFELIIKNITLSDALKYSCAAVSGNQQIVYNVTTLTVYDAPLEPYPTIKECLNDTEDCIIDVSNKSNTQNLTCMAKHFFPNVTLSWTLSGDTIEPVGVDWHLNDDDGTFCGSITITARQDGTYVCTVTGEALRDVTTKSVRAFVKVAETSTPDHTTEEHGGGGDDGPSSNNAGMIIGIVIAIAFCVMFVLFLVYVWWVKTREKGGKQKFIYTGLKGKSGKSVEEDDERRAGAKKTTTAKDDNFAISEDINEVEDDKKREKPKEEETSEKSEKNPESKVSATVDDHGDHEGHGGGHTDHSHSGGGGGGGGGGGSSSHHESSHDHGGGHGGGHDD